MKSIYLAVALASLGCQAVNLLEAGEVARSVQHWAYQLPHESQTQMVSVAVTVADLQGRPVANADVLAYCEPWDFIQRGKTGEQGRWTAQGPKGVWSFFAASEYRSSRGVLAALRRVRLEKNAAATVRPDRQTRFMLRSPAPSDFHVRLTPTDLPGPVACIHCGSVKPNTESEWAISSDLTGIATVVQQPEIGRPGRLEFVGVSAGQLRQRTDSAANLGRIRFHLESNLDGDSWWNFHFDPIDHEAGEQWPVVPRVPPGRGTYEIDVSPGRYRVWADFHRVGSKGDLQLGAVFAPRVITVVPNKNLEFSFSTQLRVKGVEVLAWNWMVHLWFDLVDRNGHYVDYLSGTARVKVRQGDRVAYEGPVSSSAGRYLTLQKPLAGMRTGVPIEVEYTYDSPVMGKMNFRGLLPQDRPFSESLPVIAETEHFRFRSRDSSALAIETLHSLEKAFSWLADNYAGPVRPAGQSRFEVGLWCPVHVAMSSGDFLGADVYAAGKLVPSTCPDRSMALFHEFGHSYQGSPPHHQATGMGSSACESHANLISAYCLRALQGERVFREVRQFRSRQFFDFVAGRAAEPPDFDRHFFILLYIDARYGFGINRDFFRAAYSDEGNCSRLLAGMDFLANDHERIAALYSFLAGENLSWLYRWARLPVSEGSIDQAMRRFQELKAVLPASSANGKEN